MTSATTVEPAEWIAEACRGTWWTVGALVPNRYPLFLRVHAPDPSIEDWWSEYRELFGIVAAVGERHTSSPDRAWFGLWEGHGFANQATLVAWQGPLDDDARQAVEQERARLRDEDDDRNAAVSAALSEVPRFDVPNRSYYLVTGPVAAATELTDPGSMSDWRNPDLFWPDDRRWFVATDVDFWSLYVGGHDAFISELVRAVPTHSELVPLDHRFELED